MAGHLGWTGGSSRRLGACVLGATLCASPVTAQDPVTRGATSRLRAVDPKAAALLAAGKAGSATFRLLTETIEQSDLVVYVETRQLKLPGQLLFVTATPGGRYLRIAVRAQGLDYHLIPWLAHELWHAVELARAPEVRDREGLLRFYQRIGGGLLSGGTIELETVRAQETQATVLRELRSGRW